MLCKMEIHGLTYLLTYRLFKFCHDNLAIDISYFKCLISRDKIKDNRTYKFSINNFSVPSFMKYPKLFIGYFLRF